MNWFRQNPFLTVYIGLVVIGVALAGFFISAKNSELSDLTDQYDAKVQQLKNLQSRKPFPNAKNVEAVKATAEEYVAEVEKLREEVTKLELPLPETTPEAFQDALRRVVSDIEARAAEVGTRLPVDFYMGFDRYKSNLPTPTTARLLSRQLSAMTLVVNRLLELKVEEIVAITRPNLPEEGGSTQKSKETDPAIVTKSPFEIIFRSDQGKARIALNSIVSSEHAFFILRSIVIENSQLTGPSRVETGLSAPTMGTVGVDGSSEQRIDNLRIIVGRENVTVGMQLEMVTFDVPEVKL